MPPAKPDDGHTTALTHGETVSEHLGTLVPHLPPPAELAPSGTKAVQTIKPTPDSLDDESDALAELAATAAPLAREVEPMGVLGRGGMGVVHLARQRSLSRLVAVKSANPDARAASARRSLLREAWAAAALEHPNVVPVYTLAVDEAGEPHVVMRRIEGRTWLDYLAAPDKVRKDFGVRDLLAWHLGVLMQVCNAMHFAHSKDVLHRDLKPENVMIGRFGEVWVLDWGLAVRTGDAAPMRLPIAALERRIVGTPRYMAPEMARGDGKALSARTDVYLLGSLLHVILTGRGPHLGDDVKDTVARIPDFRPKLPAGTPERLAAILHKAMAPEPELRHESAEALRLDLQAWLEEASADRLVRQAEAQLLSLRHDLEGDAPDRQQVYRHFGACRFGFRQALETRADHPQARAGLGDALLLMVRYELGQGDAKAAEVLLDEHEDPPAALVAEVRRARAAQQAEAAELARMRQDRSESVGVKTRVFVFGIIMVLWTLIPAATWVFDLPVTWERSFVAHSITFVAVAGLVVWARDSLGKTALNRRVAQLLVTIQAFVMLSMVIGYQAGWTWDQVLVAEDLFFACITGLVIDLVGWTALVPATAYALTAMLGSLRPDLLMPLNALANLVMTAFIWFRLGKDLELRR